MSLGSNQIPLVMAVISLTFSATASYSQDNTIRVASTSRVIIDNLPLFIAEGTGALEKHGLGIETTHFSGGGEVVRAVSAGTADIGMVATSSAIIAAGRGEPVKIFSGWSSPAYGIVWIVPVDSEIHSAEELAGKNVGISRPGSVSHTGLLAAMSATDIGDNITITPVGGPGDSWTAVSNGRVDATWHTAPNVLELVDSGQARIIFEISDYLKEYAQGSLIVSQAYLDENEELLSHFLEAVREANEFIETSQDEAARIGSEAMGVPEEQIKRILQAAPAGFFAVGPITEANYAGSLAEAMSTGGLQNEPSMAETVDDRLLK